MKSNILIHPDELNETWIQRLKDRHVDILGLHPTGGATAADSLEALLSTLQKPEFRSLLDSVADAGIEIEYEMHAAGWLLPRHLFDSHPEYFRMDENGERTPRRNLCVSNREAMDLVASRAVELAKSLYRSRPYYYFWMDDSRRKPCHCEKCRQYSPSEQYMLFVNRITEELRKTIPNAKVAYLAYFDFLNVPKKVLPTEGVFLEFAPIDKYTGLEFAETEREMMQPLLQFFGTEDAKVLEYWLDNSLFSNWKKPPKEFSADPKTVSAEVEAYRQAGFEVISTFGCFLGEDYEALYGAPDISPFTDCFVSK